MSLDSSIAFIVVLIDKFVVFLNSINLIIGGYSVSFFWLVISFILISIIVSVFWRGAKG